MLEIRKPYFFEYNISLIDLEFNILLIETLSNNPITIDDFIISTAPKYMFYSGFFKTYDDVFKR